MAEVCIVQQHTLGLAKIFEALFIESDSVYFFLVDHKYLYRFFLRLDLDSVIAGHISAASFVKGSAVNWEREGGNGL